MDSISLVRRRRQFDGAEPSIGGRIAAEDHMRWLSRESSGNARQRQRLSREGSGDARQKRWLAAKAVETQGKGDVLATKAVETQGKGSV